MKGIQEQLSRFLNNMEIIEYGIIAKCYSGGRKWHQELATLFEQTAFLTAQTYSLACQHRINLLSTLIPNFTKLKEI